MASILRSLGFFSVPDLSGKTAVVTGANSGVGYEVVRTLANHRCRVVMGVRSLERGTHAAAMIQYDNPEADVHVMHLDLEDLKSVKAFAQGVLASVNRIDVLVNAAGRFLDSPFKTTADGFEVTYASVFWGHAYLTLLLLERIMKSEPARIVQVISFAEMLGRVNFNDLKGEKLGTSGLPAYSNSKIMAWMWLFELQMRLKRSGKQVDCFGTQPGNSCMPSSSPIAVALCYYLNHCSYKHAV